MKGYAKVEVVRALQARDNYIKFTDTMEEKFHGYAQRYYDWKYPQMNFIERWIRRNDCPVEFLCVDCGWDGYSRPLRKVLTDVELEGVRVYEDRHNINKISAGIRKLCYASSDGLIMVDRDIAGFIEKWEYN